MPAVGAEGGENTRRQRAPFEGFLTLFLLREAGAVADQVAASVFG